MEVPSKGRFTNDPKESAVLVVPARLVARFSVRHPSPLVGGLTHVTIFSNLTGAATSGGYIVGQYSPGNSYVIGPAFTPTGENYRLNGFQVLLSFSSGVNDITLRLYEDSGGVPGLLLESWHLVNVLGSTPTIVTLDSVKKPQPLAGRQYWITPIMAEPTSVGVWWINTLGQQGIATASLNGGPFTPGALTTSGFHALAVDVTVTSGEDSKDSR